METNIVSITEIGNGFQLEFEKSRIKSRLGNPKLNLGEPPDLRNS